MTKISYKLGNKILLYICTTQIITDGKDGEKLIIMKERTGGGWMSEVTIASYYDMNMRDLLLCDYRMDH